MSDNPNKFIIDVATYWLKQRRQEIIEFFANQLFTQQETANALLEELAEIETVLSQESDS